MGFQTCRPPQRSSSAASAKRTETSTVRGHQRSPSVDDLLPTAPKPSFPPPKKKMKWLSHRPHASFSEPPPKPAAVLIHETCFPAVCPQNSADSLTKPPKVRACRRLVSHRALRGAKVVKNGSFFAKGIPIFGVLFPALLPPPGAVKLPNPIKTP